MRSKLSQILIFFRAGAIMTFSFVRHMLWISLCTCFLLVTGCAVTPKVPLDALSYPAKATGREDNLLVLLRGLGGSNTVFEKEGIIDEIRRRRLPFDIVAPDTNFSYLTNHTLVERLKTDIIDPARRKGYRRIWIAGFSMGGLGALIYLRSQHSDVEGVILISPYLGLNSLIQEIKDAGGVASWQQVTTSTELSDWSRLIWSWIKEYSKAPKNYPPIYLGYGSKDWIAQDGPSLLATVLPENRVLNIPGNHDINTLKLLFFRQLDMLQIKFPVTPAPVVEKKLPTH